MDLISGLITIGKTIIGTIIPPLKKKFFDQPKIYIRFDGNGASRIPGPASQKNDFSKPFNQFELIRIDTLKWRYRLIFRNNSEHPAYNIKLLSPKQDSAFMLEKKIDNLLPLLQNTELVHNVEFQFEMEGTGSETADAADKHPDFLLKNKFVLEYTNVKGTKFYTIFDGLKEEEKRNQFVRTFK